MVAIAARDSRRRCCTGAHRDDRLLDERHDPRPHKTATVSTDLSVISQLYSALVLRGPDLKIKGDLATSWKAIGDLTWRFQLTPGVTFPNGEKLDAEAVKWNFERVLDPKVGARIKSWFAAVKEVKAISPTEVEIVTSKPFPALVDQLSMFFLLPPQWAQQNNPAVAAMGTGPYELKEFRSGERVTLVRPARTISARSQPSTP